MHKTFCIFHLCRRVLGITLQVRTSRWITTAYTQMTWYWRPRDLLLSPSWKGLGSSIVSSSTPSANTVITSTTPTTTISFTSSTAKLHRKKCYWWNNGYHCFDLYGTKTAACIDGYCVCSFQDYDYHTCLRKIPFAVSFYCEIFEVPVHVMNSYPRQPNIAH